MHSRACFEDDETSWGYPMSCVHGVMQFRRLVRAIQNIALTLNRHYPARLHRLYLVDAPAIVHLPVRVRLQTPLTTFEASGLEE
jgi:hypothetical protein